MPHADTTGNLIGILTSKHQIYYSVKYTGSGLDVWTFVADKCPEKHLDIILYKGMSPEIYQKCAIFINDVDFIKEHGLDFLHPDKFKESIHRHNYT